MAGTVTVTLEVFGDKQIERKLLRFGERAIRGTPLWNSIYQDLLNIERVQFLTEGSHGSGGWEPLAPATVAEKARRGQPPWILRASETLFKSLTASGAPGNIREVGPTFMRYGSNVPYGIYHQRGTVKMPMRKVIDLRESERVLIVKKVQRFIVFGEVTTL